MSACHHVSLWSCQLVSLSICQLVNMATCQHVNMSTCHEMSNVIKCHMPWNEKCYEMSKVVTSQLSWNFKRQMSWMSNVMKRQMLWNSWDIKCQPFDSLVTFWPLFFHFLAVLGNLWKLLAIFAFDVTLSHSPCHQAILSSCHLVLSSYFILSSCHLSVW